MQRHLTSKRAISARVLGNLNQRGGFMKNFFTNAGNKSIFILGVLVISLATGCLSKDEEDTDTTGGGTTGGGGGGGATSGESVLFDGTAEYLTTSSAWLTGDFTICLWMKPSSVDSSGSSGHTLLSMSSADKYFYLSFDNNELDWKMESSDDTDMNIDGVTTFTSGNTYQVCVTGDYGGNLSRAYVNGAQVGGVPASLGAGVAAAHTTLTIGYDPAPSFQAADGNKTLPFAGVMDNVMIWTSVLPANAISQLYAGGAGMDPQFAFSNYTAFHVSNLEVYYLMGDYAADVISGGSAVINDQLGNQNATPVNFESTDWDYNLW